MIRREGASKSNCFCTRGDFASKLTLIQIREVMPNEDCSRPNRPFCVSRQLVCIIWSANTIGVTSGHEKLIFDGKSWDQGPACSSQTQKTYIFERHSGRLELSMRAFESLIDFRISMFEFWKVKKTWKFWNFEKFDFSLNFTSFNVFSHFASIDFHDVWHFGCVGQFRWRVAGEHWSCAVPCLRVLPVTMVDG